MNKTKIEIDKILFPKNCYKTQSGDFAIFTAKVIEHMDGEFPQLHERYRTITLKGVVPSIKKGNVLIAYYDRPEVTNFGTSYKLTMLINEIDKEDKTQVKDYLTMICGATLTKELMKLDDPIGLLEKRDTETLLKVKGIGIKKLEHIYDAVAENVDYSSALGKLEPLGLTKDLIIKICKAYGSTESAIEVCTKRPYDLVKKVRGISFSKADDIARKCALDMNSDERLECLIYVILEDSGKNGKTFLYSTQLTSLVHEIMFADFLQLNKVICKMRDEKTLILVDNGNQIALTYYFDLERQICAELRRIAVAETHIKIPNNWSDIVKNLEQEQGWEHTDEQWNGIETVLNKNVTVVTGKAGTGKSTVTNAMTRVLEDYVIRLTCLSAKASDRISQVTGLPASTIHRLLNLGITSNKDEGYGSNEIKEIDADIVIVDESSMVNGELFLKLLKAIRSGCKLIVLGDDGQLQAIGDCSVFSDLLTTEKIPVIKLNKIHRQAQKSAITTKSIAIRNQERIYPRGFVGHTILGELQDLELYIQKEKDGLHQQVIESFKNELIKNNNNVLEVQVIVPMKNRGDLSTQALNTSLQRVYNKEVGKSNVVFWTKEDGTKLYVGDKVINTKNNYKSKNSNGDECPVYNGSIGIITKISKDGVVVQFDGFDIVFNKSIVESLSLAYAITVHSSQGSQWDSVIVALDASAWLLLTVEMLYTAITRASKHCVLIAEDKAINHALKTVEQKTKQTYLSRFLTFTNF